MKNLTEISKVLGINFGVLLGTTIVDTEIQNLIEWIFKIAVLTATLIYTIIKIRRIK